MYPLPVVLIGCSDEVAPHVRRELLNQPAQVEAEFPDVKGAITGLRAGAGDSRLLIIELRSAEDVPRLRRLSGNFSGHPILALVPAGKDHGFLIQVMRAGAAQVVSLPVVPDDFRAALECIGLQFGYTARDARVVAVSGVTGGCGATSLAINLGYEVAFRHRLHCVLVELALRMGMFANYLDVSPRFTVADLLAAGDDLDVHAVKEALTRVADDFDVLSGQYRSLNPVSARPAEVLRLVELVKKLARVVVLDVPCTYDDLYFETLAAADQVVLVGEQKVPSIRALQLVRDTLLRENVSRAITLVINRYDPKVPGFDVGRLEELMKVPGLHTVAADAPAFTAALNHGRVLRLETSRSPALEDLGRLADHLLDAEHRRPGRASPSVFDRLVRAFGLNS